MAYGNYNGVSYPAQNYYSGYIGNTAEQGRLAGQYQPSANYPISAPTIAQMPPQQASNGILWVQGEEGAKAYLTAPGTSVLLMDSENNTFYIKSSDQSGMPMPLRVFDYAERTAAKPTAQPKQQEDFVTREEFNELVSKFNKLAENEQPITSTKGDNDNG